MIVAVNPQLYDMTALEELRPPDPWFVQGPRGGLYEALGAVTVLASSDYQDYFIRNLVAVKFVSDGVRYLRPGSARHGAAKMTFGRTE